MSKNSLKFIIFAGLFAVPFIPFLVSGAFFFPFITTKAFAWRIIIEVVFAAWLLLALLEPAYRLRKSSLVYLLFAFLIVVGIADFAGVAPVRSMWSNFERMEGFISLLHLGAFFLVIASVFKEADWKRWWNTSLVASFLMVLYCFLQIAGVKSIAQGGVRVDGTFGNAIYLAVYLLFHIFIALLFMVRTTKSKSLKWIYAFLILSQVIVLYYTATRGTILGLLGGLVIFALLNARNREATWVRKASIALIAGLVLLVGGFVAVRHTNFVEQSPVLSRFATLSVQELETQGRYFIWPMAWQGIKEHPFLGWGQENFNYVFQEHYRPEMYNLEPWFDRAHNVFLDWAIAGGLISLILYLGFYLIALSFICRKNDFSYVEKSIFTSLIAAYFFHNIFVFDHLFSYILFFAVLAYLHYRHLAPHTETQSLMWQKTYTPEQVRNIFLPLMGILLVLCLYFVNWKPLLANVELIGALQTVASQPAQAIADFEKSYQQGPLGQQEEMEQMALHAPEILASSLPIETRNQFYAFANNVVTEQVTKLPNDVRVDLIAGMFLTSTGANKQGLMDLEHAKTLSPTKQDIYFQIGSAYFASNEPQKALQAFKEAYELAPQYPRARSFYLIAAIYVGDSQLERKLITEIGEHDVAFDDNVLSAYYSVKRYGNVAALLETRKRLDPANAATYDSYLKQLPK